MTFKYLYEIIGLQKYGSIKLKESHIVLCGWTELDDTYRQIVWEESLFSDNAQIGVVRNSAGLKVAVIIIP